MPLPPKDKTPEPARTGGVKPGPGKDSSGETAPAPRREGGMETEGGPPPAPEREGGMIGEG